MKSVVSQLNTFQRTYRASVSIRSEGQKLKSMAQGTVKWFNSDKSFGLIAPDGVRTMCSSTTPRSKGMDTNRSRKTSELSSVSNRGTRARRQSE
jgi:hypothetical protein